MNILLHIKIKSSYIIHILLCYFFLYKIFYMLSLSDQDFSISENWIKVLFREENIKLLLNDKIRMKSNIFMLTE